MPCYIAQRNSTVSEKLTGGILCWQGLAGNEDKFQPRAGHHIHGRCLSAKPTLSLSCTSLLLCCQKCFPKNYSKRRLTNVGWRLKLVFVQHHVHEEHPIISEGVEAFLGTDWIKALVHCDILSDFHRDLRQSFPWQTIRQNTWVNPFPACSSPRHEVNCWCTNLGNGRFPNRRV